MGVAGFPSLAAPLFIKGNDYMKTDIEIQQLTPLQAGASELACEIINHTFLSLDGFEPTRRSMDDDTSYPAIAFAASLARVVDRVIFEHNSKGNKT